MRKLMLPQAGAFLLWALGFIAMAPRPAVAQSGSLVDVGVDYNYVRSNLPAGGCGCFSLNGGGGWAAFNFTGSLGIVGEIASQHASNISSAGADLTLTSFLAGLAPGSSGLPGSANAFAMTAGGGLDIGFTRHIALRAFEADYYLTRFENGTNDHQNNLRLGAGVMVRLGGSK